METELAATQVELTDIWGRALYTLWGGKPPGEPISVRRPGEKPKEKKKRGLSDPDEIRAALGAPPQAEPAAEGKPDTEEGASGVPLDSPDDSAREQQDAEQEPQGS
jgi:hypothetical protein